MSKRATKNYCTLDFRAVDDSLVFYNSIGQAHYFTINESNHIEPLIYRSSWSSMLNKDKSENQLIKRHKQFTRMVTKTLSMKNRNAIDDNGKILNIELFIDIIRPAVMSDAERKALEEKYQNLRKTFYDNAHNSKTFQHFDKLFPSNATVKFVDDYIKWREIEDKKITVKDSEAGALIDFHDIEQSLLPGVDLPLRDTDSMPELLSDRDSTSAHHASPDSKNEFDLEIDDKFAELTDFLDESFDESLDSDRGYNTAEPLTTAFSEEKSNKRKRDGDRTTTSNKPNNNEDTTPNSTSTKRKKGQHKLG